MVMQEEAGVLTDSHTTSWVSAGGTSRSSSGNDHALQPDAGNAARSQTVDTPGSAQKDFDRGGLLHAVEEAAAEIPELQGMAGVKPDLEEEEEALDAAAALDAMRAPGAQSCKCPQYSAHAVLHLPCLAVHPCHICS